MQPAAVLWNDLVWQLAQKIPRREKGFFDPKINNCFVRISYLHFPFKSTDSILKICIFTNSCLELFVACQGVGSLEVVVQLGAEVVVFFCQGVLSCLNVLVVWWWRRWGVFLTFQSRWFARSLLFQGALAALSVVFKFFEEIVFDRFGECAWSCFEQRSDLEL